MRTKIERKKGVVSVWLKTDKGKHIGLVDFWLKSNQIEIRIKGKLRHLSVNNKIRIGIGIEVK